MEVAGENGVDMVSGNEPLQGFRAGAPTTQGIDTEEALVLPRITLSPGRIRVVMYQKHPEL